MKKKWLEIYFEIFGLSFSIVGEVPSRAATPDKIGFKTEVKK
jgi:hypothetical protein